MCCDHRIPQCMSDFADAYSIQYLLLCGIFVAPCVAVFICSHVHMYSCTAKDWTTSILPLFSIHLWFEACIAIHIFHIHTQACAATHTIKNARSRNLSFRKWRTKSLMYCYKQSALRSLSSFVMFCFHFVLCKDLPWYTNYKPVLSLTLFAPEWNGHPMGFVRLC